MKRQFFKILSLSLATSVVLVPFQEAVGQSIEDRNLIKNLPLLLLEAENRNCVESKWTHNRGQVQQRNASESMQSFPEGGTSQVTQSCQPSQEQSSPQISSLHGGLFAVIVLLCYLLTGIQYRKYRIHQAAVLLQQVAMLERIWHMSPRR